MEEGVGDGEAAGGEHGEEELASVGDQDLSDSFHGFIVCLFVWLVIILNWLSMVGFGGSGGWDSTDGN